MVNGIHAKKTDLNKLAKKNTLKIDEPEQDDFEQEQDNKAAN